jgi:exopolysaccharide production protein ExoZ
MEGIRGLAILLVFFVHYHTLFGSYASTTSWTFKISHFAWGLGHSGVDLFFVLSGFLIYGSLIRKPVNYFQFLRRRVQRIYPAFLVVFSIYICLSLIFPSFSKFPSGWWQTTKYIVLNLALVPGIFAVTPIISVAWSLSYEFFFYLTIPLLVTFFWMRHLKWGVRVAFILLLLSLRFTFFDVPPIRMAMFCGGILVYEILEAVRAEELSAFGEAVVATVFFASFIPIALLTLKEGSPDIFGGLGTGSAKYRILVMLLSFSLFCVYCLGRTGTLSKLFSWNPLRWLGNMSYSYYLIHGLTLHGVSLAFSHIWPQTGNTSILFWILLPVAFIATILTSTLLFLIVEKPYSIVPRRSVS